MAITSKTILIAGSLGDLELLINASIDEDGRQPSGPIFVTAQGQYAQAMIEGTEQDSISGMQDDIVAAQEAADAAQTAADDAQQDVDNVEEVIADIGASFAVSDDGAIDPTNSDSLITQHVLSKATAGAYTMAFPSGSSRIIVLLSTTAAAHVVTLTDAVVRDGTATATYNTLTFAAQVGASIVLSSVGSGFVVLAKSNVTLSTV